MEQFLLGELVVDVFQSTKLKFSPLNPDWLVREGNRRKALSRFSARLRSRYNKVMTYLGYPSDDISVVVELLSADKDPAYIRAFSS